MKRKMFVVALGLLLIGTLAAQVPYGFNYQGIARNSQGEPMSDQQLDVLVSILAGSADGDLVWEEQQSISTNKEGLFSLVICGTDDYRTGGSAVTVAGIDWSSDIHFIGVRIDAGQGWVDMGVSQINSVPYSLASRQTIAGAQKLEIKPDQPLPDGEALFIVKRNDGYPVFAVYNNGVWVYTDTAENAKAIKGGFAVGGYRTGNKGAAREFFRVTPDSTKIFVTEDPVKGIKGGFAVGGYSTGKAAISREFLRVTSDSTRVYVNSDPLKGIKGGFAVGGYQTGKAAGSTFMSLEKENYFIGHNSGSNVTSGLYNSVMGYESGLHITEGESNAFLGYQSGYSNTTGTGNLFLGYQTGYSNLNGSYNTFMGYRAGQLNTVGRNNTFLGSYTGNNNVSGNSNTFIGDSTGFANQGGHSNTFLGTRSGLQNTIGFSNVMLGNQAGYQNREGNWNVFVGHRSGYANLDAGSNVFIGTETGLNSTEGWNNIYIGTNTGQENIDGEGNVFIGYESGLNNLHGTRNVFIGNRSGYNAQGSDRLFITNWDSDSTNSLIWGDFSSRIIRFNSRAAIGMHPVPANTFSVYDPLGAGTIGIYGEGNGFDYSAIYLRSDTSGSGVGYTLSHTIQDQFYLGYNLDQFYAPRMVIDKDGNMGINTYPGGYSMTIEDGDEVANLLLRGTGNAYEYAMLSFESMGEAPNEIFNISFTREKSLLMVHNDGNILNPRLHIDSLGHVSINTWEHGTEMLDVNGNARFRNVGAAGSANDLRITSDGTLTTSTSDVRMKTGIEPMVNSLEKVLEMRGVTFRWKQEENGRRDAGLIAQEVAPLFPEAVFENGNSGTMGINYSRFAALFVEAFKDQQKIIEEQQQEIDALKQRLERLEEMIR